MRQGFGYKFQKQARLLTNFVSFMEEQKATTITTKLAVDWATQPPDRHASWVLRLAAVRGFARHVAHIDPATEVPRAGILPRLKRSKPYNYSDAEIANMLGKSRGTVAVMLTRTRARLKKLMDAASGEKR